MRLNQSLRSLEIYYSIHGLYTCYTLVCLNLSGILLIYPLESLSATYLKLFKKTFTQPPSQSGSSLWMVCDATCDVACCESALCWTDLLWCAFYGKLVKKTHLYFLSPSLVEDSFVQNPLTPKGKCDLRSYTNQTQVDFIPNMQQFKPQVRLTCNLLKWFSSIVL